MAGPGSGRRARGDCRGEGPAPLIQQSARTSGSVAAATLVRNETLLPGVGPTASSRNPGSSCRHIINKPPARSSGPSQREASREAALPAPPPAPPLSPVRGPRVCPAHVTLRASGPRSYAATVSPRERLSPASSPLVRGCGPRRSSADPVPAS